VNERAARWMLPSLLALTLLAAQLAGPAAAQALRYQRAAILHGQLWRLLSAHLVHLGWGHCLLNIAGLGLLWLLFSPRLRDRAWLLSLAVCAPGTSLGLLWLAPQIQWYVGLSGVLHGLFASAVLCLWQPRDWEGYALALGLASKLLWEHWLGPIPGSAAAAGGPVVVAAHLYGAAAGLAAGLGLRLSGQCAVDCGPRP
jgi:rhomboid family GlyGly-CTERM serine protease